MRDQINLTDEQIEEAFTSRGHDGFIDELVFTKETISDFKKARDGYREKGHIYCDDGDCFEVEGVQTSKGQQRRWLVVVDFGTVRAVAVI